MLLLLCYTGDPKRITYWAEITAPLISNGRCIVYVDFDAGETRFPPDLPFMKKHMREDMCEVKDTTHNMHLFMYYR